MQATTSLMHTRIVRDMQEGILVIGHKGEVLSVNSSAKELLDMQKVQEGEKFFMISSVLDSKNDAFHQLIFDAINAKSALHEQHICYEKTDGSKLYLKVSASYLLGEQADERIGIVLLISDETEVHLLHNKQREATLIFAFTMICVCVNILIWSFTTYLGLALPVWVDSKRIEFLALLMAIVTYKTTDFSFRDMGLILTNPKETFVQSIAITIGCTLLLLVGKVVILQVAPSFFPAGAPFWDWSIGNFSDVIYPFTAVMQEFLARGVLQSNLRRIFVGKHGEALSILVSALIFAVLHISYGLMYMLGSFLLLGLMGILYNRHGNIWGTSIIHYVLGEVATFLRYLI